MTINFFSYFRVCLVAGLEITGYLVTLFRYQGVGVNARGEGGREAQISSKFAGLGRRAWLMVLWFGLLNSVHLPSKPVEVSLFGAGIMDATLGEAD